ncbi:3-phosphoshikimate 1-carboxyvinyltransferase [Limisalsivibrio acetivorans]|uniref:3-phosphoshikimate 1-carboxyvinyltransferase n=1 Tax=Limisalsivibrio acetivorans TaxID=1304888 RepID=UPI0003B51332|nr:3-phosphoshikimate 1-carboxyvinyltransferase [Limisalsivibrio acetivorans]
MTTYEMIKGLRGEIEVPTDKSITHRSFMLGGMAEGTTRVTNPLMSRDTKATMAAMQALGAEFSPIENGFIIESKGFRNFIEPSNIINCENSGTTARLLTGVITPAGVYAVLTGDDSLRKRPMDRVIKPLSELGARMEAASGGSLMPLTILPSVMKPGVIDAVTKSAQVKSSILLAGVQLEGTTIYNEKVPTRNHSEIMLRQFGADVQTDGLSIAVHGAEKLTPSDVQVPGDISSAAFFIGAALMFENSSVTIKNVGLNPTRTGIIEALEGFGVKIEKHLHPTEGEPIGDIHIESQNFKGGCVKGEIIANMIDELPMLAHLGLFAENPVEIREAAELRVKESDRISAVVHNLRQLGAQVEEYEDGLKVYPLEKLTGEGKLKSFDDHRIAMLSILLCKRFGSNVSVDETASIDVSFPNFPEILSTIEVR